MSGARSAPPPIVCLEGPSAVGKTSLAESLGSARGARIVPELDATGAPPAASAEPWFADRHVERWQRACALRSGAPFVVIDGDPLKGLWYNWMHAEEGWPGAEVVGPLYRERIRAGKLAFPDLYVVLDAPEEQLRARRARDPTRRRRGFEKHVRKLAPQRRYFAALQAPAPRRVAFVDTHHRASLVGRVEALIAGLPPEPPNSSELLEVMLEWLRTHSP